MSDPMPTFVIKARDNLAPGAIANYAILCETAGLYVQAREVRKALAEVVSWREAHREECKWPDHMHVPAGLPGSGS
jgi:F420-dependent methylenetetrahydromethanopterin dehydrogenase